jgi:hypothetical protein
MTDRETKASIPAEVKLPPGPAIIGGDRVMPIFPRNIDEALRYAKMILLSGMAPESLLKDSGKPVDKQTATARVVSVILAGTEVGMGPMSAMANIALINGRRVIWGEGAIALIQGSGHLEWMKRETMGAVPDDKIPTAQFADDYGIRVTLKRKGQDQAYVGEYTVGDAKRAHLWMNTNKRPWIEHPTRQLFWRAFHIAASSGFSDRLAGLNIRELVSDEPPSAPPTPVDTSFLDSADPVPAPSLEAPQ